MSPEAQFFAGEAIYDLEMEPYDRDVDRTRQDRLSSTGGLASLAYWIVRAISVALAFIGRKVRRR
jgi:hypothetical protein